MSQAEGYIPKGTKVRREGSLCWLTAEHPCYLRPWPAEGVGLEDLDHHAENFQPNPMSPGWRGGIKGFLTVRKTQSRLRSGKFPLQLEKGGSSRQTEQGSSFSSTTSNPSDQGQIARPL